MFMLQMEGVTKRNVKMASGGITKVQSFVKIGTGVQAI
jgi:hypothetical protein